MLLDLDPQGGLTLLYPTRPSERQIVASGAARAIPSADPKDHILVTAPFGSDQVTVFAFEQLPAFLADLNGAERFSVNSGRADALARGLAHLSGAVSVQQVDVNTYAGNGKDTCGP
jgi:cellulose biosynthesis protein BcsQ